MLKLFEDIYTEAISRGIDPADAGHFVRSIETSAERLYQTWPPSARWSAWILLALVVVLLSALVM